MTATDAGAPLIVGAVFAIDAVGATTSIENAGSLVLSMPSPTRI